MIYLDNFATTPVDPRVLEYFQKVLKDVYGNPSSVDHEFGKAADTLVTQSRRKIADLIDCEPGEIIFTSGATESISLFLQGYTAARTKTLRRPLRVVTSPVEHPAVLENLKFLNESAAIDLDVLNVDTLGRLDIREIEAKCKSGIDLICVMAVNNEVGNIYPIQEIAHIASENQVLYFCDATQAIGKTPVSLGNLPDTVVAISGHKFYAPKGIGVLILDKSIPIRPQFYGGGQQRSIRPGTINAPLIAAIAFALELAVSELDSDRERITKLRDHLQSQLRSSLTSLVVNGDTESRVGGALHISLPGKSNKQIITGTRSTVAISTGAACSSGAERPSHVLKAMGLNQELIEGALRISLGRFTSGIDIEVASRIIQDAL